MERDRQHGSSSDLNGPKREEKNGTYPGGVATVVIDHDGVVLDVSGSFQRWSKVDIG